MTIGRPYRSMAVEAVRIADGTPEEGVTDVQDALLLGARTIKLDTSPAPRRDRAFRIHAGPARRAHGHRLHRPRRLLRSGYLQPLRRGFRARAGRKVPRQVRADRRHRRLAGRPGRLALRPLHRCARRSTRRPDAGRRSAGQCDSRHPGLAILRGAFRHGSVSVERHGGAADPAAAGMGAGRARTAEAARRAGGNGCAGDPGELPGVSQAPDLPAAWCRAWWPSPVRDCWLCCGGRWWPRPAWTTTSPQLALSGDLLAPAGPGIPGPYHWARRRSGLACRAAGCPGAWSGRRAF